MSFLIAGIAFSIYVATLLVVYAIGARAGYFRGVSWGMHLAGREMMHVLACGEGCPAQLPPPDPAVIGRPGRRPN